MVNMLKKWKRLKRTTTQLNLNQPRMRSRMKVTKMRKMKKNMTKEKAMLQKMIRSKRRMMVCRMRTTKLMMMRPHLMKATRKMEIRMTMVMTKNK